MKLVEPHPAEGEWRGEEGRTRGGERGKGKLGE